MFSWCPFPLLDNTISNGCQWSKQLETLWALLLLVLKLEIQSDKCEIYMAGLCLYCNFVHARLHAYRDHLQ